MSQKVFAATAIVAAGVFLSFHAALAAGKKALPKADPGLPAVEKVLRTEVAGSVDRRQQLVEALKETTDSPTVRWQAGFIRDGKAWRSFDESFANASETAALNEYRSRRSDAELTFAGQLALADWCQKQGLVDQERAHLSAALATAPEDRVAQIRQRLGWRQLGGVWLAREDLLEWHRLNLLTETSLRRWDGKLNKIAKGLSGLPKQRDAALTALREIKDPDAVPAIEMTLAGRSEELASAAVGAMRRIEGPAATLALAKQAVFSQWPAVREAAAAALQPRPLDDFAPPLISLLATPVKSELQVSAPVLRRDGARGQFVLHVSLVLSRETENQFQVASFNTTSFEINEALNGARMSSRISNRDAARTPAVARGANDALRSAVDGASVRQRAVDEINAQTAELNDRVGAVLAVVSGKDPTSNPNVWWDWWKSHSETELAGDKQTVVVTEDFIAGNPLSGYWYYDCLAAGTPVWTEMGLQPIEKISVGDRVLAQDVESGELDYKPVLRTTIRPPKEQWSVRVSDETLVMTGGHRFWNSGGGWVKARDLEAQMLLHTVTGNTPVWTARKGDAAQTYNLVVADFHTYFVGTAGILSQDVLTPRATGNLVPGLSRTNAVANSKK